MNDNREVIDSLLEKTMLSKAEFLLLKTSDGLFSVKYAEILNTPRCQSQGKKADERMF